MTITMISDQVKRGFDPGTYNMQLHYLVKESDGTTYNVIRRKFGVPAAHPCMARSDVTALERAQHCEAAFRRKKLPNDFYYGDSVHITVWKGSGLPSSPQLPNIVHVHHSGTGTILRDI